MINDNNVKFVYRCMDTSQFRISNCPSVMSYVSNRTTNIITYYILFICTKRNYQKLGYATGLLLDFIKDEKMKNEKRNYKTKIILSSLETAVTYYEKIGFRWTRECLSAYPVLCKYEKFEKGKEYFIMECVP
jgi:ribosomal protein S18 acetylase RimI-like enzyme